jgi:molybdenum transport protein
LFITDETINKLIKEDIPYLDLTTHVLNIGSQKGSITYTARQNAVICGTDVAKRIFEKLEIKTNHMIPSGTMVNAGDVLISGQGSAESLHMAWKVCMNILEYCSGIATRTRRLVDSAKKINPKIEVVTTRKIFPGTKELSIKAAVDGGALPHRLGLSETILIFQEHTVFLGGIDGFLNKLAHFKARACEKKITVETKCREDALKLCRAGVDGIQFDKIPHEELRAIVEEIREINPEIILIATGGINAENIEGYAATGVDSINTTWVYFGKPVDVGVKMELSEN